MDPSSWNLIDSQQTCLSWASIRKPPTLARHDALQVEVGAEPRDACLRRHSKFACEVIGLEELIFVE